MPWQKYQKEKLIREKLALENCPNALYTALLEHFYGRLSYIFKNMFGSPDSPENVDVKGIITEASYPVIIWRTQMNHLKWFNSFSFLTNPEISQGYITQSMTQDSSLSEML